MKMKFTGCKLKERILVTLESKRGTVCPQPPLAYTQTHHNGCQYCSAPNNCRSAFYLQDVTTSEDYKFLKSQMQLFSKICKVYTIEQAISVKTHQ